MGNVRPRVELCFACADAKLESDGTWTLRNPFSSVWMPPGIAEYFRGSEFFVYSRLTDGVGEFRLSVQVRVFDTNTILMQSPPVPRKFPEDRLEVLEVVFHMTNIPFPRPGLYEIKIPANHAELEGGSVFIRLFSGGSS